MRENAPNARASFISEELSWAVEAACERLPVDCVLLSGGVDSSLISAYYGCPAITVALMGSRAPDVHFAQMAAEKLGLYWLLVQVHPMEAMYSLCSLMALKKSFDRGIFNDLPMYWALRFARCRGWHNVGSGEGAELLFAGYDFLIRAGSDFRAYRRAALDETRLSETFLGGEVGVMMKYPYLSPEVISVADRTDLSDCVFERSPGELVSKVPLRSAAMRRIPPTVAWRDRADIEDGSGFSQLGPTVIAFAERFRRPDNPCRLYWDEAHQALHRMFTGVGLRITPPKSGMYGCEWCGGGVAIGRRHCPTCGAFPAHY
ncbi:asparagine synthase C-terminal domain-containing protein [Streptomyces massasporeus]|uniref:asparagine synthase C-terminal domain-containing protein n=1 Tax=Streptomyces massasporeus TaxID=67324 RepID=UPI0036EB9C46